jgi:PadR family transcriptional regulator, regulatory protein PadR
MVSIHNWRSYVRGAWISRSASQRVGGRLPFRLRSYLYTSRVEPVSPSFRVTDATLDVLEVLLHGGAELYGLKIAQAAGRPTGSVFPILARLEGCGWAASEWEAGDPAARGPRRRFYQLSPDGIAGAGELLAQRKAKPSRRHPSRPIALRPRWQAGR